MNGYAIYTHVEGEGRVLAGGTATLSAAAVKVAGMGDGEYEVVHQSRGAQRFRVAGRKAYLCQSGGELLLAELD